MRLSLRLVWVSQFLYQFKLNVHHKLGKEYMVRDALNRLANANIGHVDLHYLEIDVLFTYSTTLVKVHLALISQIFADYKADS